MQISPKVFVLTLFLCFSFVLFSQQRGSEIWSAKVYPNPSEGVIHVELTGLCDDLTHINIVDMNGRSVFWKNIPNDQTHTFDLTSIPKGHYTVQLMSTNVYMKQPLILQ
jgi:hypothetical protein